MLIQYAQLLLCLAVAAVKAQEVRQHIIPGLGFRITSPEVAEASEDGCNLNRRPHPFAGVEVRSNYTEACYNIEDIFAEGPANRTGTIGSSCHWDGDSCSNEWRYTEGQRFDSNATNSVISLRLSPWPEHIDAPAQVFRTFEYEDCDEAGDWHQWVGCENERDECRELPYGVRSFRVSYQSEDNRTDECVFAGERGALESGSRSLGASVVGAFAATLALMVFG